MTARAVPDTDVALRLLLVEDDARYAGFIGATLMGAVSAHFQYDHVASIRAAVRQLSQTTYDLVLLDLGLPDVIDLEGLTLRPSSTSFQTFPSSFSAAPKMKRWRFARSRLARRTTCRKAPPQEKCFTRKHQVCDRAEALRAPDKTSRLP